MLHRGFTTQTDYRDSEAQTEPATLGTVIITLRIDDFMLRTIISYNPLRLTYFENVLTDYAYDYKDVLPEVSALEMLRYGPGGGLPIKDEYDLQNVDRLRYQKMQCDNLPSVQDSNRTLVQNRLLGKYIIQKSFLSSLLLSFFIL